ncbi:MAG: hypothetical protein ABI586_04825 [Candidatus Nanopelagicales bacterium]
MSPTPHALAPDRGRLRPIRGSVVGLVALATTVGLHALVSHEISTKRVLLLAGLACLVGTAASGRQWGLVRSFVVLLGLQPMLHVLLVADSHAHTAAMSDSVELPARSMVLAHVIAAVIGAVAICYVDSVLWRYLADAWRRLFGPSTPIWVQISNRAAMPPAPRRDQRHHTFQPASPRRGPPTRQLMLAV